MAETKVRFTGEDNVSPILNKLKKESEELGRGIIRDALAYTKSSKETVKYIEEQITALERRSQANKKIDLLKLSVQRQQGEITQEKYQKEVSRIENSSPKEDLQIALLKEVIETMKQTSKREIIENRKNVEKELTESKTLNQVNPEGDEFRLLQERIQRNQLEEAKKNEHEEKGRFRKNIQDIKNSALAAPNQAGGMVAGAQNQFYLAATIVGMIPFIGAAAGSLMERAFSTAERYQTARGGITQLTGGNQGWGWGGGLAGIGLTKGEFLEFAKQGILARGGMRKGTKGYLEQMAVFEKATGFDRGLLLEQEKLSRSGGLGSMTGTQNLVKALQSIGVVKGQDTTIVNEYLPLLVNIQQEQLKLTGETNNKVSTDIIAGITHLDETFKNPEYLKNILPTLLSGMRQSSTPQTEALQFRALSGIKPGASLLELEAMRESPTLEYVKKYLEELKGVSAGNEEMFVRNIRGAFGGLSTNQAIQIARGYSRGGLNISDYSKELGITGVASRAGRATGLIDASSADWAQTFETVGNDVTNLVQRLIDQNIPEFLQKLMDALSNLGTSFQNFTQSKPVRSITQGTPQWGTAAMGPLGPVVDLITRVVNSQED